MRTRSKIRLLASESNDKSHLENSRSNRLVEKSKTIIRGKKFEDPNESVQSIDEDAVKIKRKRYQSEEVMRIEDENRFFIFFLILLQNTN